MRVSKLCEGLGVWSVEETLENGEFVDNRESGGDIGLNTKTGVFAVSGVDEGDSVVGDKFGLPEEYDGEGEFDKFTVKISTV